MCVHHTHTYIPHESIWYLALNFHAVWSWQPQYAEHNLSLSATPVRRPAQMFVFLMLISILMLQVLRVQARILIIITLLGFKDSRDRPKARPFDQQLLWKTNKIQAQKKKETKSCTLIIHTSGMPQSLKKLLNSLNHSFFFLSFFSIYTVPAATPSIPFLSPLFHSNYAINHSESFALSPSYLSHVSHYSTTHSKDSFSPMPNIAAELRPSIVPFIHIHTQCPCSEAKIL